MPPAYWIVASLSPAASSTPCRKEGTLTFCGTSSACDEEKCLTVLRNCHRGTLPASKLFVIESVIPPGNEPFLGKFLDMQMLLIPGGKERTENEYRALIEQPGFELPRIVPTGTEVSIVEGK